MGSGPGCGGCSGSEASAAAASGDDGALRSGTDAELRATAGREGGTGTVSGWSSSSASRLKAAGTRSCSVIGSSAFHSFNRDPGCAGSRVLVAGSRNSSSSSVSSSRGSTRTGSGAGGRSLSRTRRASTRRDAPRLIGMSDASMASCRCRRSRGFCPVVPSFTSCRRCGGTPGPAATSSRARTETRERAASSGSTRSASSDTTTDPSRVTRTSSGSIFTESRRRPSQASRATKAPISNGSRSPRRSSSCTSWPTPTSLPIATPQSRSGGRTQTPWSSRYSLTSATV